MLGLNVSNYKRHLAYLRTVRRHRKFVYEEGRKLGLSRLQLWVHDWTKFTPLEWFAYARCFNTPHGKPQYEESPEFDLAWNSHQKRHKHHWQHWVLLEDSGKIIPLPMPDKYRREMLADWRGAGRAYGNSDTHAWYAENGAKMRLHTETRKWIERQFVSGDV